MPHDPGAIVALRQGQIVIGIDHRIPRGAVADLQIGHRRRRLVDELVPHAAVGRKAHAIAGGHLNALLTVDQGGGAAEDVNKFILLGVMVLEGRNGPRRQCGQVDAEVAEAEVIPQLAFAALLNQRRRKGQGRGTWRYAPGSGWRRWGSGGAWCWLLPGVTWSGSDAMGDYAGLIAPTALVSGFNRQSYTLSFAPPLFQAPHDSSIAQMSLTQRGR